MSLLWAAAGAGATSAPSTPVFVLMLLGAGGFGAVIGWFVYYVNRHRKEEVKLGDVVTLIGAIGGAAVLSLFEAKSAMFGAYGLGLALGFFGYFYVLVRFVRHSMATTEKNFTWEWFLDGRRRDPSPGITIAPGHPMAAPPQPSVIPAVGPQQPAVPPPGRPNPPIR